MFYLPSGKNYRNVTNNVTITYYGKQRTCVGNTNVQINKPSKLCTYR